MSTHKSHIGYPSDREMIFTRAVDAPRDLVWEVYTNPTHVARWWGPKGFTNTIHEMDVRPGGIWRLTMHGPDGTNYPNRIAFLEVVKPARLVYDHGDDANPKMFHVTTDFVAEGERTKIVSHMRFKTAAECEAVKAFGIEGHKTAMERLDAHLAEATESACTIVNVRVFPAAREAVWGAFADPVRLAQWWGPNGFTNTIHEFDLRVGGRWRITLHGPDSANYDNEKTFIEVVPQERVAFEHHQPMHHFVMTMAFADEAGGTRLEWRMRFDSAEACAKLRSFIEPANEQNLDRLAAQLAATN